jgi:predicted dehydrogenase
VGICEINNALREHIVQKYGVQESFRSVDEALQLLWDAAVIATPANSHISIAHRFADAGAALFIEKPLSVNLEGVTPLVEKVRAARLLCSVAYVYRSHPALTAMRQALLERRFGRPLLITLVSGQHFPLYRPAYRETYYRDRATGGGAVQDALTHFFNAGEWLIGPIEWVAADTAHQALTGVTVEDTVVTIARHGSVLGSYCLNQHQAPNESTLTVICERGVARFEIHNARWLWMAEPQGDWNIESCGPLERDSWFTQQENLFLDALEGKRPPLCTFEEAIQTLKVNLAVLRSAESGSRKVFIHEI